MFPAVAADLQVSRLRGVGTAIFCAFFVSGACGLIHEVVWTRLLRVVMGNTTFSITTVLCAFMGGLALGSYLAGRLIDHRNDPLRVFALLEGIIGIYCLLLPWLIGGVQPLYSFLYQHTQATFYVFSLIRFLFSGLILLVPATFMGATLPVLTRFFTTSPDRLGWSVGTLYAVNTFGAVLGASASGFLLIPALGVTRTIYLASLFNLLVAAAAYLLHKRTPTWEPGGIAATAKEQQQKPVKRGRRRRPADKAKTEDRIRYRRRVLLALLVGYGFSGFAALVYEIAWTRALSLLIGSTVYAFSAMLTAFVLGLAAGSAACARFADRLRDPLRAVAAIQVGIALSALVVVPVIGKLPLFVTSLISGLLDSFWQLQLAEFLLVLGVMLVPTTLMGAAFPLVNRIYNQDSILVGRSVGEVYAANTLGTILGSFTGGFLLIPWLGIQKTIFVAVSINTLVGVSFLLICASLTPRKRWIPAVAAAAVAAGCIAAIPDWDPSLMSFGPYHEASRISKTTAQSRSALAELAAKSKVLYHKEGLTTTVTVKEVVEGVRALYINGKPDASSLSDLPSQEMVAHIPLLMHPDPKNALVVGLASGISLGSAGRYPLEELDCLEISPAMIEACRYFDDFNYRILDDPRVNIVINDARNHLALTAKQYDVIISQPSNPYIAGVADLFTREFFELSRQRLSPDGVMCTWVQAYNIGLETFRSIVRTFQEVFPNMSLWRTGKADCLLVGSKKDLAVDYATLARRLRAEAVAVDLRRIEIGTVPEFLAQLVMGPEGVRRFAGDARIHTDDNALVEFAAPRALTRKSYDWNLVGAIEQNREVDLSFLKPSGGGSASNEHLREVKEQAGLFIQARGHVFRAHIFMNEGRQQEALAEIREASRLNPADPMLKQFNDGDRRRAYYLAKQGKTAEAIKVYRQMIDRVPGDEKAHYNLATVYKRKGDLENALYYYRGAARLQPDYIHALYNVGELSVLLGLTKEGVSSYRRALEVNPDFLPALTNLARVLATYPDPSVRDPDEAVRLAEKAAKIADEKVVFVLDTLSLAYAAAGRMSDAERSLQRAIKLAESQGKQKLAQQMRRRLQQYEQELSSKRNPPEQQ